MKFIRSLRNWWWEIQHSAGFSLVGNAAHFRGRAEYHQYCLDQDEENPCKLSPWRRKIILYRMRVVTRVVLALRLVKPFVYSEAIWLWFKWLCLSQLCKLSGHKMIDDSYGGPDSGCMAGHCIRCGWGFHTQLY